MKSFLLATGAVAVLCLGMSIAAPARAADMSSIRTACAKMGLNSSEAPFVYCVQSLAGSAPPRAYAMTPPTTVSDAGGYDRNSANGYGAENACAEVGLNPATAQYSYCVGNLNQTLFDEENFLTR